MPLTGPGTNSFPGNGVIIIDETPIVGGTDGYVLYDNNGVVGVEAGGGGGTITEGTTPTSGFTDGYAITSSGGFVGQAQIRTILTGNLDLYVNASTGSDSYNGLSATYTGGVNGPFATPQHAVDVWSGTIDSAGFTGKVNIAAGNYEGVGLKSGVGGGILWFSGAGLGVAIINDGANDGIYNGGDCISCNVPLGYSVFFSDVSLTLVSASATNVTCDVPGQFISAGKPDQSACNVAYDTGGVGFANIFFAGHSIFQDFGTTATIAGTGGISAFVVHEKAQFIIGGAYTVTGTPTYNIGFMWAFDASIQSDGATFSGSATGPQGLVENNGVINIGTTTLPGNAPIQGDYGGVLPGSGALGAMWLTGSIVDSAVQVPSPSSGDTITLNDTDWHNIIKASGTLATLTIVMNANPFDGQIQWINTKSTVTALTVNGNAGQSVNSAPTTLAPGMWHQAVYTAADTTWYFDGNGGGGGGGSLTVTDGSTTVSGTTQIEFVGAAVSGTTPDAVVTIGAAPSIGTPVLLLNEISSSIASGSASGGTSVDAPIGSRIVLLINDQGGSQWPLSCTDSAGNVYAPVAQTQATVGHYNTSIWTCANIQNDLPIGGTFTAAMSGGGSWAVVAVKVANANGDVAAGIAGMAVIDSSGNYYALPSNMALSASIAGYSLSLPTTKNTIVFGASQFNGGISLYIEGAGFTSLVPVQATLGDGDFAYSNNVVTTTAWAPSWTGSQTIAAVIAAFKAGT